MTSLLVTSTGGRLSERHALRHSMVGPAEGVACLSLGTSPISPSRRLVERLVAVLPRHVQPVSATVVTASGHRDIEAGSPDRPIPSSEARA